MTKGERGSSGMVLRLQRDPGAVEDLLGHLAGQVGVEGSQVDQDHVVVGAARDEAEALLDERPRERLGVGHDPGRVGAELGPGRLSERDRLGGDGVLEGPALQAREDGAVDLLGQLGRAHDGAPAGPRSVLWVVKLTTSATPTGLGCTPPTMRPAGWAASKRKSAPTSSAIWRNGSGSMIRE